MYQKNRENISSVISAYFALSAALIYLVYPGGFVYSM